MLPQCYKCTKSIIGEGVLQVTCSVDSSRKIFTAPFTCPDYIPTLDGQINYQKEVKGDA